MPALFFALAVIGGRVVQRRLGPILGVLAFAALWTAFDFLASFDPSGGAVATPGISQVDMPYLIQGASLFGPWIVTFLLGAFSASIAISLRTRTVAPAAIAIGLFVANVAFGVWHMSGSPAGTLHVALIDSNDTTGAIRREDKTSALKVIDAYVTQIEKLRDIHPALIVLPENIARLGVAWRNEAIAPLTKAAQDTRATIVAGFNTSIGGALRNVSLGFEPNAPQPVTYIKRRLVPVLETAAYTPGSGPKVLPNGAGLEICKDMDFQAMIRNDEIATKPRYLAVPAWDFGADGWMHARPAIMRSVENGVPMARTARDGLLTLNDRYGRVVAMKASTGGFTILVGDLPLAGRGGETLYDRIGDLFGWLCVAASLALYPLALFGGRTARPYAR
jgi:apolipoprotein N-acyltransferase